MVPIINPKSTIAFQDCIYNYNEICKKISICRKAIKSDIAGRKIAIYANISDKILFFILAILTTNCSYIPIDSTIPEKRLKNILTQIDADIIITEQKFSNLFKGKNIIIVDDINWDTDSVVTVPTYQLGEGIAYTIFTSGSTGEPKGVSISKKALNNFLEGTKKVIDYSIGTKNICISSISFDMFVIETIFALYVGFELTLADNTTRLNPKKLLSLIKKNNIDTLMITPGRLKIFELLDSQFKTLRQIKLIIVGGESISDSIFKEFVINNKTAKFYNAYGPTETTVYISYRELHTDSKIDIGEPIQNSDFYLINDENNILYGDFTGELCISGDSLFEGYVKNPQETNDRYVYIPEIKKKVYKTGDICHRCNNKYYWLGRKDNQIKLNGYRIEIEDIEKIIKNYIYIDEAVILSKYIESSSSYILILIIKVNTGYCESNLNKYMRKNLPPYMLPQIIKIVEKIPYNDNGKLDRNKLKELYL